ncbi:MULTISPECIES: SAM-dependent methyltransferase [unclassified Actinopolyspora]|uniref:SAM-dependent methyltransferase n=1 Tax=unclassified Actinopolyspora TaxID=2639451 RepID=UPI0013F5F78A|nr:methyltransferase domain-containing protein [Actinopolyspora sp. BKK2]NHE74675.1 methyltransferase domain-containing protein [Actinopolyspora sp. BKK1]
MSSTPLERFGELHERWFDPWDTARSWYERRKRAVALACLPRPAYAAVVEPACGIGAFTAELAPRCARLAASDGLEVAVRRARQRLAGWPHVSVCRRRLPDGFPPERASADLVVLSEILYYLDTGDLDAVVDAAVRALRRGGELLAVHWRPRADDAARDGDSAHRRLRERSGLEVLVTHCEAEFRAEVLGLR